MSDIKQQLLAEAGNIVDGARRSAYGTPEDNFERIARFWQAYFENTGRAEVQITAADVSPLMRLLKEARLCESPDHMDSFVDIIGYTLTGAEINMSPKPVDPDPLVLHARELEEGDCISSKTFREDLPTLDNGPLILYVETATDDLILLVADNTVYPSSWSLSPRDFDEKILVKHKFYYKGFANDEDEG